MFYNDPTRGYSLIGVYRVTRNSRETVKNEPRSFSTLALRIHGKSLFEFNGKTLTANEKSLLYIPKGIGFTRIGEQEEIILLHLNCHGEDDTELSVLRAEGLREQFEALLAEWEAGENERYNRSMAMLYLIFETIAKSTQPKLAKPPEAIAEGVRYLQAHYRDSALSVARLATLCHISEVYFRRLFHSHFGLSPWHYISELRFSYACTLLQSGYYSIKEVAMQAGFSDVKYFRVAFGKRYGCTPSEYTKKL